MQIRVGKCSNNGVHEKVLDTRQRSSASATDDTDIDLPAATSGDPLLRRGTATCLANLKPSRSNLFNTVPHMRLK